MASKEKDSNELEKAAALKYVPWCEEYEKMISGMLYDPLSIELREARLKARIWSHKYNNLFSTNISTISPASTALEMLKEVLGNVEPGAYIEPPFRIDYGCNISLGKRFQSNFDLTILDCSIVTIGDRVMFGPHVSIITATHETEVQSRRDNIEYSKSVTIRDDCWIGANVVILPGVTIGEGCTIGAASVVTRDIPAWSVAMGSPARVVRSVVPVPYVHDSI